MSSTRSYYGLMLKMKPTVQTSLNLPQNSLKEKRFMKLNQLLNTEDKAGDTNTSWNGKAIRLLMQRGNQNWHSPMMATCWPHTKIDISSDKNLDYTKTKKVKCPTLIPTTCFHSRSTMNGLTPIGKASSNASEDSKMNVSIWSWPTPPPTSNTTTFWIGYLTTASDKQMISNMSSWI